VTMRERSLRRFMLITPEKVCFERLYCAVRFHNEMELWPKINLTLYAAMQYI
jgi:hypothetical protein